MSDSPRCLNCLEKGKVGQFYKMVGSSNFKCQSCGKIRRANSFEPIEFEWKVKPDEWKEAMSYLVKSDEAKKRVKEIRETVK